MIPAYKKLPELPLFVRRVLVGRPCIEKPNSLYFYWLWTMDFLSRNCSFRFWRNFASPCGEALLREAHELCSFWLFSITKLKQVWFLLIKKAQAMPELLGVAGAGLEPATFGLWAQRATNCSTPRYVFYNLSQPHLIAILYSSKLFNELLLPTSRGDSTPEEAALFRTSPRYIFYKL